MAWIGDGPKIGRRGYGFQAAKAAGAPHLPAPSSGQINSNARRRVNERLEHEAHLAYLKRVIPNLGTFAARLLKQGGDPDNVIAALWAEADRLGHGRLEYEWTQTLAAHDGRINMHERRWIVLEPNGTETIISQEAEPAQWRIDALEKQMAANDGGWLATSDRFPGFYPDPYRVEVRRLGAPRGIFRDACHARENAERAERDKRLRKIFDEEAIVRRLY